MTKRTKEHVLTKCLTTGTKGHAMKKLTQRPKRVRDEKGLAKRTKKHVNQEDKRVRSEKA